MSANTISIVDFVRNIAETPEERSAALLLRGWRMLQMYCPMCYHPLMQDVKGGDERVCPHCLVKIVTEAESESVKLTPAVTASDEPAPEPNPEPAPAPTPAAATTPAAAPAATPKLAPTTAPATSVERGRAASKLLGARLLAGDRMLADMCEDCGAPKLQTRAGKVHCIVCSEEQKEMEKMAKIEAQKPAPAPVPAPAAPAPAAPAPAAPTPVAPVTPAPVTPAPASAAPSEPVDASAGSDVSTFRDAAIRRLTELVSTATSASDVDACAKALSAILIACGTN